MVVIFYTVCCVVGNGKEEGEGERLRARATIASPLRSRRDDQVVDRKAEGDKCDDHDAVRIPVVAKVPRVRRAGEAIELLPLQLGRQVPELAPPDREHSPLADDLQDCRHEEDEVQADDATQVEDEGDVRHVQRPDHRDHRADPPARDLERARGAARGGACGEERANAVSQGVGVQRVRGGDGHDREEADDEGDGRGEDGPGACVRRVAVVGAPVEGDQFVDPVVRVPPKIAEKR